MGTGTGTRTALSTMYSLSSGFAAAGEKDKDYETIACEDGKAVEEICKKMYQDCASSKKHQWHLRQPQDEQEGLHHKLTVKVS